MAGEDLVRELFNEKADRWSSKYQAGGGLVSRIDAFGSAVSALSPPPARVVEIGCGTGNLSAYLNRQGYEVIAFDIAERMLEQARGIHPEASVDWRQLSPTWTELPLASESTDAIVASSVLEYVSSPSLVLRESARVLRRGGLMVFSVPNPQASIRKLEGALKLLVSKTPLRPVAQIHPRLARYSDYLTASRNRFSVATWSELARGVGLIPACSAHLRLTNSLLVLCFRKSD